MAFKSGGAWADQVEHEESTNGVLANNSDFPTLGESAKTAPPKGKVKAKPTKMGLADFMSMGSGGGTGGFHDKSLQDKAILASLPTGPRGQRDDDGGRPLGGLGGGFRDYGGRGDREGGFRGNREDRPLREDPGPSRADAVDDWGSSRKYEPTGGSGSRPGGGGGFGGGGGAGGFGSRPPPREPREFRPSAADEVDDWGTSRKYEPSAGASRGGFGDDRRGFSDRDAPRRFEREAPAPSKADVEDSWGRGTDFKPSEARGPPRSFGGPGPAGSRETPATDKEDRWARRGPEPSTSAADGAGVERPRLKLQPRTAPAGDQASSSAAAEAKKSNPFGAARPREEVLKEKGVDPVKETMKYEHGEVQREETSAERDMKAEITELQAKLADLQASSPDGVDTQVLAREVDELEKRLLKLQAEEDDKVRFARTGRADGPGRGEPARGGSRDPRDTRDTREHSEPAQGRGSRW